MTAIVIRHHRSADFSPHQRAIMAAWSLWRGVPRSLLAVTLLTTLVSHGQTDGTANSGPAAIRLNTVGYLPGEAKVASIPREFGNFFVVRASDGVVVYSNTVSGPVLNADTEEQLWQADFSAVSTPGKFQLEVPGVGRSPLFAIDPKVYREPFWLVERGF